MKRQYIIVVDVGSSSIRASPYEIKKNELHPYPDLKCATIIGSPMMSEYGTANPKAFLEATHTAITVCTEALRSYNTKTGFTILALGFDCFVMNWMGVDETGEPVTPLYTYADSHPGSSRAARRMRRELKDTNDVESSYQRTGVTTHSSYVTVTLKRLQDEEPELLRRVKRWQTFTSWFTGKLCGDVNNIPLSYSEASWTGLLNIRTMKWDAKTLKRLKSATFGKMPELADFDCTLDRKKKINVVSSSPHLNGVPVFLAVGDGAAANVGSGCTSLKRIAVTIGTSAATRIVLPNIDRIPKGLWCYRIDRNRLLLGGAMTDGGSINQWILHVLRFANQSELTLGMKKIVADDHGLTVLPFLRGERAPGWCDGASMTISNIKSSTTQSDIARACVEACLLRLGTIIHLVLSSFEDSKSVRMCGSGSVLTSSPLWCQILADITGRVLYVSSAEEATSRGVAMLLGESLNIDISKARSVAETEDQVYEPNMKNHVRYMKANERLNRLYESMLDVVDEDEMDEKKEELELNDDTVASMRSSSSDGLLGPPRACVFRPKRRAGPLRKWCNICGKHKSSH